MMIDDLRALPAPFGWFQVGWSTDLLPGEVRPLFYLDRHLVLWRDHQGVACVQEAFCPHLGAHLGHGGKVDGATIVCPLHGWAFDAAGTNVDIPYSERFNRACRLRGFPVVESNGLVLAWFHPHGEPPMWQVPELAELSEDSDYVAAGTREFQVRAPWQEMAENGVDSAHFGYVHGQPTVPCIDDYETDGPVARMRSTQRWPTPDGEVDAHVEATSYGPGVSVVRMSGIIDTVTLGCNTPVSADRSHLRFTFAVRRADSDALTKAIGGAFVDLLTEQVGQDIVVWEHKTYRSRPALADNDGPIMRFRTWARQFHADAFTVATGAEQDPESARSGSRQK